MISTYRLVLSASKLDTQTDHDKSVDKVFLLKEMKVVMMCSGTCFQGKNMHFLLMLLSSTYRYLWSVIFMICLLFFSQQRFETMPTTVGCLDPPLGNTRLQTVRLIAALVLTNTHTVNVELANLGTIKVLLVSCFSI